MMRRAAVALLLAGCATRPPIDPAVACRIVRDNRASIVEGGPRDLYELSYGTPAHHAARNAVALRIAAYVVSSVGAAALVAGLATGLATDPATQPEARAAGYGLAGGAIGLGVVALVLGYALPSSVRRAREELSKYGDHCQ